MKIKPLFDWIIIERASPTDRTSGGIIIPDSAQEDVTEGVVVAAGPGKYKKAQRKGKAKFHSTTLKAGQRVFFAEYMTKEFKIDGKGILFIREKDVYGIVEKKTEIALKVHFPVESKKENKVLVRKKGEFLPKVTSSEGSKDQKLYTRKKKSSAKQTGSI